MRILCVVSHYAPARGGVAVHTQRLAEGLACRGHNVTVLTSRDTRDRGLRERLNGVEIVRVPVMLTAFRSPVMPTFLLKVVPLIRHSDVVDVHIPLIEAGLVSSLARRLGKPVILRYHCDFEPQPGVWSRVAPILGAMNRAAAENSEYVVATTQDYADHSDLLQRFRSKVRVVAPPVGLVGGPHDGTGVSTGTSVEERPVIATAARMAPEKGIHVLFEALPLLLTRYPRLMVTMTGESRPDIGCDGYFRDLRPALGRYRDHIHFVGYLDRSEMPAFYFNADLVVVPSVDSREAFGMVQVEAMLCGTPVVASNLPGVREPIKRTGMGLLAPPGDPRALAEAIRAVIDNRSRYLRPPEDVARVFDAERVLDDYEKLHTQVAHRAQSA
jgi:glycosyltransferase involved in cell wall biosynthesis